jgi:hypothetical protein
MNNFQKFILFFAVFILIITFISIGLAIHNSKIISWPPIVPSCPDYWLIDGSGNNTKCINSKDLGTCKPSSGDRHLIMDFNDAPYVGSNGNPCNSSAPSNSTTNSSNLFDWFMTKKNNYT